MTSKVLRALPWLTMSFYPPLRMWQVSTFNSNNATSRLVLIKWILIVHFPQESHFRPQNSPNGLQGYLFWRWWHYWFTVITKVASSCMRIVYFMICQRILISYITSSKTWSREVLWDWNTFPQRRKWQIFSLRLSWNGSLWSVEINWRLWRIPSLLGVSTKYYSSFRRYYI